jgi:hypothetical protein
MGTHPVGAGVGCRDDGLSVRWCQRARIQDVPDRPANRPSRGVRGSGSGARRTPVTLDPETVTSCSTLHQCPPPSSALTATPAGSCWCPQCGGVPMACPDCAGVVGGRGPTEARPGGCQAVAADEAGSASLRRPKAAAAAGNVDRCTRGQASLRLQERTAWCGRDSARLPVETCPLIPRRSTSAMLEGPRCRREQDRLTCVFSRAVVATGQHVQPARNASRGRQVLSHSRSSASPSEVATQSFQHGDRSPSAPRSSAAHPRACLLPGSGS